jgi:hypothetical protein
MIYIKDFNPENKTIKDLIDLIYNIKISHYSLIPTYNNKECTDLQCSVDRRRSLHDLFELTTTYFPNATFKELFDVLVQKELKYYYCYVIKRIVIHYSGTEYLSNTDPILYLLNNYLDNVDAELEIKNLEELFKL